MMSEDFSFPKISNPLPHFAISPSLWRVSSVVYPDFCIEDKDEDELIATKSLSILKKEDHLHVEKEEKMDMLWEDFNEEISSLGNKKQVLDCETTAVGGGGDLQPSCRLQISKRGAVYHPNKKQSLILLVKVLKKIFLLHKSTQIKNNN